MEGGLISLKEKIKLKVLCDFLISERFDETTDFSRFKMCLEYLFLKTEISLENIFDYIVGFFKDTKKKRIFLSFTRLYEAYLNYKMAKANQNADRNISYFFDSLIDEIILNPDANNKISIGHYGRIDFTSNIYLNDELYSISSLVVLCDKNKTICGLKLKYNNSKKYRVKLYYKNKNELYKALVLRLETDYINNQILDSITHIFGTFDKVITFIGFKCSSGKTVYFGKPNGKSFIFGMYGKKVQYFNLIINENGISRLEAVFTPNKNVNKNIEYNQNDVDKIYNEEKKLIENKENDYEQLRKTQIQTEKNNPLFAYIDENNSKNENDKNTIISKQNIEGDYSINPNPFLNIDNNKIIIPNPFFKKELQKKKNELKGTQVSVCIGAKRNIFDNLDYNNLKIKLTKSQGIKKMNFEELKEKLRKDIENRGRIIDLKEKVKGNIYKNLLKLFKNKIKKRKKKKKRIEKKK